MTASHEDEPGSVRASYVAEHVRRFQPALSTGAVAFRFDDAPVTDLPACWFLSRAAIPVEIAVITSFVGRPTSIRAAGLRRLLRAGHTIANHSRVHGEAPATVEETVAEIERAAEWFREHRVPTWSFVQPGSWAGSARPGGLTRRSDIDAVVAAIRDRIVCVESYAGAPFGRVPLEPEARYHTAHVTIDRISWVAIQRFLDRVVSERLFAVVVLHSSRIVKTARGPLIALNLARLVSRCVALERAGSLRCTSVLGGVCSGLGGGESLLPLQGASIPEKQVVEYRPVEPLIPGISYLLRVVPKSARGDSAAAQMPSASICAASEGLRLRVHLRRAGDAWQARFCTDRTADWRLELHASDGEIYSAELLTC